MFSPSRPTPLFCVELKKPARTLAHPYGTPVGDVGFTGSDGSMTPLGQVGLLGPGPSESGSQNLSAL